MKRRRKVIALAIAAMVAPLGGVVGSGPAGAADKPYGSYVADAATKINVIG